MERERLLGHIAAITAVVIWGTTFISSKILLRTLQPTELLILRFVIGFLTLTLIRRRFFKFYPFREELLYALAGLTGITLYYLLEGVALTYTMATNVGVIISTVPFFTAVLLRLLCPEEEKLQVTFFLGFIIAMAGICLISYNGAALSFNPLGDLLTLLAALVWAFYSYFLKRINRMGRSTAETTHKLFFWGLLFMLPAGAALGFAPDMAALMTPVNIGNLLFLGIGACAICFLIWNFAEKAVGAVRISVYIYLDPIVTLIASWIILKEPVTGLMLIGTGLTLAGLLVSEIRPRDRKTAEAVQKP